MEQERNKDHADNDGEVIKERKKRRRRKKKEMKM